ncbi:MAG: hypothetical protein DRP52_00070 [Planctomycetota bacterium]|nr:MAG: hypothetical protein DRP52_00070 [Planctomycetota bacterium]
MTANNSIITFLAAALVLVTGCQQPSVRPKQICPGKATARQAAAVLGLEKQNVQPMRASADCVMSWRGENGDKKDERVSGKLAFVPPGKIFFKGDKFGEIRFGANETQFWLRVKPELDSYWWGSKALADQCDQMLLVNPVNITEALGIVVVTPDWKLIYRDGYDILSLYEDQKLKKRVYINACDYRIEQIEYFDGYGMKKVSVELTDYWAGDDGLMVPSTIRVGSFDSLGAEESSVQIKLKHIRPLPPEKQKKKLFQRPGRDGYEHLYRLDENCGFIEE